MQQFVNSFSSLWCVLARRGSIHYRLAAMLGAVIALTGNVHAEVRTIDGDGNNLLNGQWGMAGTQLVRLGDAHYGDGISSLGGVTRPNARTISNTILDQPSSIPNARGLSDFVWQWGQFLDHDISLTPTNRSESMFIGGLDPDDPLLPGIPMSRSIFDPATGDSVANPRQQVNVNTSFIDASMVYGSDYIRAHTLRTFSGGKLIMGPGNMLPKNTFGLPNANDVGADEESLYLAGDVRANEQPGLIGMHTLFSREHNRLADELASANPAWDDETIYQHARRHVAAQVQVITYNEFLPALLGDNSPTLADAAYDEQIDAGILNEFSAAIFRFGHSLVPTQLRRVQNNGMPSAQGDISLRDGFFNPTLVADDTDMNEILKGLATQPMQELDAKIVDDLRNMLFGPPGGGGLDLATLNIVRGRDHGLPDYNTVRTLLGLTPLTSFDEITSDTQLAQDLEGLYGSIADVDTWVGVLAEDHLPGTTAGETLTAGLLLQFTNLRDGDRFFFEFDDELSDAEKSLLRSTTLADVIMRNTGITNLQSNVFVAVPEPATLTLILLLMAATFLILRRR